MKKIFLAAVLCTLAMPALAQNIANGSENGPLTAGEAANLEKKETGVNAEEHPTRQHKGGKLAAVNRQKFHHQQNHPSKAITRDRQSARVVSAHPKTEVGRRAANQQKRVAAGLKTGQLTSREAAKVETKQAALNREVHTDREENGGKLTPGGQTKVNHQQNKLSNEIHQKKHNARMF